MRDLCRSLEYKLGVMYIDIVLLTIQYDQFPPKNFIPILLKLNWINLSHAHCLYLFSKGTNVYVHIS